MAATDIGTPSSVAPSRAAAQRLRASSSVSIASVCRIRGHAATPPIAQDTRVAHRRKEWLARPVAHVRVEIMWVQELSETTLSRVSRSRVRSNPGLKCEDLASTGDGRTSTTDCGHHVLEGRAWAAVAALIGRPLFGIECNAAESTRGDQAMG